MEYTWLEVNNMQGLLREVKQGFETNKERLLINNLREAVSFRARIRLVVATRLQAQHLTFRLQTSSNTPSVLTNDAHESFCRFREQNALSPTAAADAGVGAGGTAAVEVGRWIHGGTPFGTSEEHYRMELPQPSSSWFSCRRGWHHPRS
jgi:hypothetical protein